MPIAGLFDPYILLLTLIGGLILAAAGLPRLVRELPLSVPMVLLLLGGLVGLFEVATPIPDLHERPQLTERVTEFLVIVALMGAGLKLDTRFGWRRWAVTWRLLAIAMPLSILGIALTGWAVLGLVPASALLLGAVLAPTDPVLASDVQVGRPGAGDGPRVRFALTSEAGLNDGLAFPFVHLAVAWTLHVDDPGAAWLLDWLAVEVAWKILAGVCVGWVAGRLAGLLLFRLPSGAGLAESKDGFVIVGLTVLAYGLTELAHGYGFLGVFVAALTLRAAERRHAYHEKLHDFATEIEHLALAVLLLLLGASFTSLYLWLVTGPMLLAALLILFVVRPLAGLVSLIGSPDRHRERAVIAFFGIRGMGSFYYLAYAVTAAGISEAGELWAAVTLVVVLSILVHGASARPVLRSLERRAAAGPSASTRGGDHPMGPE
jgi:NhaP-type Na+/H+ or K+/H+ antiporter